MNHACSILVADDDPSIRLAIRLCLEADGYRVREAANGANALDLLVASPFDAMLLDLAMPAMDGMSVMAEMATLRNAPTPHRIAPHIIVMTAHGSARAAVQAIRFGATDFLEKPFTPDVLRDSVHRVMAHGTDGLSSIALAQASLRQGKFYAAEAALTRVLRDLGAQCPAYHNLAGILHEAHGRLPEAKASYQRAIELDPTNIAKKNLERLTQIEACGASRLNVLLGDETRTSDVKY